MLKIMLSFLVKNILHVLVVIVVMILFYISYMTFTEVYENTNNKYVYGSAIDTIEKRFTERIDFYRMSLKALVKNKSVATYASEGKNIEDVEELFVHMKNSLPDLFQIRYLDNTGMEKIRVDGEASSLFGDKSQVRVRDKNGLQNKSKKQYFKDFIDLAPYKIGLSEINLNKDFGRVTLPKQPTLRMGIAVYGETFEPQGVIIFNVSLRYIFNRLVDSNLYDVHIVDNQGNFILHHDSQYGLIGENQNYKLQDEYPQIYQKILNSNEYISHTIFSKKIQNLDNSQELILFLSKQKKEIGWMQIIQNKNLVVIFMIITFILIVLLISIGKQLREDT